MNKILMPFLVFTAILSAEIQFSSNDVSAENGEITLKGEVHIKHNFGTLVADEATIKQGMVSSSPTFLSACLNYGVELVFSSNQTLQCEHANIDFINKTATLWSDDRKIFFFDPEHKMTIQSQNVECEWEENGSTQSIKNLRADRSVQISLGSDIFLHAQNALFIPDENGRGSGTLSINDKCENTPCLISIGDDILKANGVTIEMKDEILNMEKPIGKIATFSNDSSVPEQISFTSNLLSWDRKTGEFSLKEQILVDGQSFGYITAKESLKFSTEKVDEKLLFKGFTSTGESRLVTPGGMTFMCDGVIDFDHEKKHLVATSHIKPILFQSNELEIHAKKLVFDRLQGDPKTISFYDDVTFSSGGMMGHAGGLTYRPDENVLEFFSTDTQNVVFYNKESDTKMCADAITIIRDPITEENTIQGHGVVKLTFDHTMREQIIEVISSCVKQPF